MRHLPVIYGLGFAITLFGGCLFLLRWLGLNRLDALYLAGFMVTLLGYFLSKRLLHPSTRK